MSLGSNVWKYYVYASLDMFLLFGAMTKVYFLNLDFSLLQIMLISSATWVTTFLFEIPSGIFSDLYGRKKAMVISSIGYVVWVSVLFSFQSYLIILFSHIFAGIKTAFLSGSGPSLIYDTLKGLGKEKEYPTVQGKADSYFLLGRGISAPLGSMVAALSSIRTTILITIVISIISLIIVLMMTEPPFKKKKHRDFGLHFTETMSYILKNTHLFWISVFFALIATLFKTAFAFTQIFLERYELNLALFGWLFLAFMLFASAGSRLYTRISKLLGKDYVMVLFATLPPIGFFLVGAINSLIVFIILILMLQIVFGLYKPAKNHMINELLPSSQRATALSAISLLSAILIAVLNPLMGYLGDVVGIFNLFISIGVFWFVVMVAAAVREYTLSSYENP